VSVVLRRARFAASRHGVHREPRASLPRGGWRVRRGARRRRMREVRLADCGANTRSTCGRARGRWTSPTCSPASRRGASLDTT
jgi:hypothetical protein